jgi:hypothetical protein
MSILESSNGRVLMAKKEVGKDEVDLDDFDFDDLDFDIPDFEDPDPTNDDRKPVTKLAEGFKEGFVSTALGPDRIKRSLGNALPRGYAQAINVYDATDETARELYHSVMTDLRPVTDGMRMAAGKISPKIKDKLPKVLTDKLEAFASGGEGYTNYSASKLKQEYEESQITNAISEMFQVQAERDNEQLAYEKADSTVRDVIEGKRHKQSVDQMTVVAQGVSRLVGYQDNVLTKYQQKSLELQYRHYFVAKDLLDSSSVHNEKMVLAVDKIVKNTALPEAVKIQKSELAGQMLKEQMIGSAFKNISNWTRNYRENLTKNIGDAVKGFTSEVTAGGDQVGALTDAQGVVKSSGTVAGALVAEKLHDSVSTRLSPYLDKMPGVRRFGAKMGNLIGNAPRKLNAWSKTETEGDGLRAGITQFFKDVLPRHYLDDTLSSNNVLSSDAPATFDNLTRRSIVEIIPGWLSQINRWTKAIATGQIDSEEEMDVYNLEKGTFTTRGNYLKDIKRRIMPLNELSAAKSSLDDFVDKLDSDKLLSEGARKSLKRKFLDDTAKGEVFDVKNLTKREFYKGLPDEHVDDLRYFFRNKFMVDIDGGAEDSIENLDAISEFQNTFNSLENVLPNSGDYVRILRDTLGRDNLAKLNLTRRVGNQETINHDTIWDAVLDGKHSEENVTTDPVRQYGINSAFSNRGALPPAPAPIPLPVQETASGSNLTSVETWDKYMGRDSILIQELVGMRGEIRANNVSELITVNNQLIAEINSKVGYIGSATGVPQAAGKVGGFLKGGVNAIGKMGKGYFDATMSLYKRMGSIGLGAGKGAIDLATRLGKGFVKRGEEIEIWIKGEGRSRLTQIMIDSKQCIDVNTGKIIKSLKDITGPVLGPDGKEVLSNEEYLKGLVSRTGKSLLDKTVTGIGKVAKGAIDLYTMPYKAMFKTGKSLAQTFFKEKVQYLDLYIRGEDSPRILKRLLEKGDEYFDPVTGIAITKVSQIKNGVKDKFGNWVVKPEELMKRGGFVDAAGKAVKTGLTGLADIAVKGAKLYGKALMMPIKAAKWAAGKMMAGVRRLGRGLTKTAYSSKFSSSGNSDDDLVTLNYYQLSVQEQMLAFLKDTFAKKRVAGDVDGDGVREGSLKDLLAKRKAKRDEEAAKVAGNGDGDKKGTFGGIGKMLAGLFSKKKKDEEDDDDGFGLSDAADVADIADAVGDRADRRRRRGSRGGRLDRLKSFGGKALGVGGKLLGGAGLAYGAYSAYDNLKQGNYGEAALDTGLGLGGVALMGGGGALMTGAAGLGTIAAGIGTALASPVVLGAAAVAGIGYGGYKLYKHFADRPTALKGMRYAQYGINPRDADQIAAVSAIEKVMLKNVTYGIGKPATVALQESDGFDILKALSIDPTQIKDEAASTRLKNVMQWLNIRFRPVFIAHVTALNSLAKGVKLDEIDDKLPAQQGADFIKAARADDLKRVYDAVEISPFEDKLDSDADDVESWVKDAIAFYEDKVKNLPAEALVAAAPVKSLREKLAEVKDKGKYQSVMSHKQAIVRKHVRDLRLADAKGKRSVIASGQDPIQSSGSGPMSGIGKTIGGIAMAGGLVFGGWAGLKAIKGVVFPEKKRPKVTLDALTAGRYKVYGLVDLDLDKVEALYNLEDAMFNDVMYTPSKESIYIGTSESIYPIAKTVFGIAEDDDSHRAQWFEWYRYRFLPTFMQFCTSVRAQQSIDARDAVSKLTLDQQHTVLVQTGTTMSEYDAVPTSVWKVPVSPWKDYSLNSDESSIAGNIEALKSAGKRAGYKDTAQKVADAKTEIEMAKRQENLDKEGNPTLGGGKDDNKPNLFDRALESVLGSKDPSGKRSGGWFDWGSKDEPNKDFSGGTATPLKGGSVIQEHPGGGTGGDINDIPAPTGSGWAASKDTILAAAKMTGFDPSIAATVANVESGFNPGIKSPTSSAGGYYQFIDSTWKETLKKHGAKYGLAPDASKYDGRANALMGMEFLKENMDYLKKRLGRPITDTDLYMAHFLGPGGAAKFLSAEPGSDARRSVSSNVPGANRSVFFEKSGNARTVSGVYEEMNRRLDNSRKAHDIESGYSFASESVDEQGNKSTDIAAIPGSDPAARAAFDAKYGESSDNTRVESEVTTEPAVKTQSAKVIEEGKVTAAAQGIQPTSTVGLTTPVVDDEIDRPSMTVKAAIAQKQSSAESGALTDSMTSLSGIMSQQLGVQTAMDVKLGAIIELLKVSGKVPAEQNLKQEPVQKPVPSQRGLTAGSNGLNKVPVNVNR